MSVKRTSKNSRIWRSLGCGSIGLSIATALLMSWHIYCSTRALLSPEQQFYHDAFKEYFLGFPDTNKHGSAFLSPKEYVQRAFDETYRKLVDDCASDEEETVCLKRLFSETLHSQGKNETNYTTNTITSRMIPSSPWWFQTLLRDASGPLGRGLHGMWHTMGSNNPDVWMCSIEKIATTQWRDVFFTLNGGRSNFLPTRISEVPNWTAPRFVFLRDPLERFLSAYLNKCVDVKRRKEGHCEPTILFHSAEAEEELFIGLTNNKKQMFAAYVDTMPFQWNMHFYPQSLYCDGIYRSIDKYDFVGNMGPGEFYRDLEKVKLRYGGRFGSAVESVFQVQSHLNSTDYLTSMKNTTDFIESHATSASNHVKEYYTAQSVRRVLEYVSIDYVMLGLQIPAWANVMLANEHDTKFDTSRINTWI